MPLAIANPVSSPSSPVLGDQVEILSYLIPGPRWGFLLQVVIPEKRFRLSLLFRVVLKTLRLD